MSLFSGEFPPLRPFQASTHEAIRQAAREGHRRILVCAPTGAGKCLGLDTPVIMSDGTLKKVQDVEVGDRLMGPDGKGRTVLSRTWGKDDLYTITPTKGDPYTVNSVHLLSLVRTPGSDGLRLSSGRHIRKDEEGPLFVEAQDFFQSNDTVKHCLKGWRPGPVDFDCAPDNHPIPPYILGIWLGDGTSKKPELSKPYGSVTDAWTAYAHSIGCDVSRNQEDGKCPLWRIKLARGEKNPFTNLLEGLGVLGNKHIPESYIMCSRDARLELLAGLLDTDGSCSHGGFDFIQKERSISESVVFLCRSLGLAAYMTESWKGIDSRDFDGQYWRVSISGDCSIIPCRDVKKKAQARLQKKNHLVTGLKIERAGYGLYFGFEIDGDRQFLLGDWQVTHNTIQALNTIKETLGKGRKATFLADRKTLIAQTSNVARDLGLGYHGIIQADNPMMDLSRPFQIASCQTLMRRGWPSSDVLIVDECFPGGTLVATPSGPIRIDEVQPGTEVFNALGLGVVGSIFRKTVFSTVLVRLSDGSKFECTYDHPVFTGMGWQPAGSLERGQRLFRLQDMPRLWGTVPALPPQDRNSCGSFGDGIGVFDPHMLREILRQEAEEPNARSGKQVEGVGYIQIQRDPTPENLGEWERSHTHPGKPCGHPRRGLDPRACHTYRQGEGKRLPDLLQGGPGELALEGSAGTRREQPPFSEEEGNRSTEGRIFEIPRVESVEAMEHRGGIDVFNLRVSGHPSYFAAGVLVHNCHTQYKTWTDYVVSDECKSFVIGLTATPFSKGLGKIFTKLINAATMAELTEQGILVPMRVFSCRKPDMSGAKTQGGEWTRESAGEVEMALIGDVLAEWQKIASDRKTIVFGPTVAYCEELAKRFNAAGITSAVFCNETPDDERGRITADFELGLIRVLISVEALAKGFDQKDVGCVCDCRPLRKSLSTAIQMWGRGLRSCPERGKEDCVLRGTKIITAKGEKNIEEISLDDKIWDGESFVSHKGAICRGTKHVISYAGLVATPEHRVKTKEGWRSFGDCASQQIRIVSTGSCGAPVREREGHLRGDEVDWPQVEAANALPLQMHHMWSRILDRVWRFGERCIEKLPGLQPACAFPKMALCEGEWDGAALPESQKSSIRGLWRAWNRVQICLGIRRLSMDPIQSWTPKGLPIGSNQQRWALRTWKSALVDCASKCLSHQKEIHRAPVSSISRRTSRSALCRFNPLTSAWVGAHLRSDRGTVGKAILQAEGEVWDILDCGPRHCFTANGLLVHNCILLDLSGNIIRFWDDFERVFHEGVNRLDEGEKLDAAVREDKDEEPKCCPKCGHTPFGRKCVACGFEVERKSMVEERPGEMQEIKIGKKVLATDKADLWGQLATYARDHAKPGRDPHKRALALYHDITGTWPPREWHVSNAPDIPPTAATLGKIRSMCIAFAHRRAAA